MIKRDEHKRGGKPKLSIVSNKEDTSETLETFKTTYKPRRFIWFEETEVNIPYYVVQDYPTLLIRDLIVLSFIARCMEGSANEGEKKNKWKTLHDYHSQSRYVWVSHSLIRKHCPFLCREIKSRNSLTAIFKKLLALKLINAEFTKTKEQDKTVSRNFYKLTKRGATIVNWKRVEEDMNTEATYFKSLVLIEIHTGKFGYDNEKAINRIRSENKPGSHD